ncbi:MAG: Nif3-like dinuclear metal center hexameric protein [Myxococcota bacterium]|nr:Nif3-like dinuclear metal center hexameric protein [Myxococcota bacterium]
MMALKVQALIETLEKLVSTKLAADWDNVGLLMEGPPDKTIERILLCIDLNHEVLDEALTAKAEAIIAYHPPIFSGLKRFKRSVPGQNLILRCIEEGLTIWSPHTALDAIPGGLGDWLLDGLGPMKNREIIESCPLCPEDKTTGMGRMGRLKNPVDLDTLVSRVKEHLKLEHVRVARATQHHNDGQIKRVAVCPGAGGALFGQVRVTNLLLTGEMRHHDVLSHLGKGRSVILTDHTNTERGYLPIFAERVREATQVEVMVSKVDSDPLSIV